MADFNNIMSKYKTDFILGLGHTAWHIVLMLPAFTAGVEGSQNYTNQHVILIREYTTVCKHIILCFSLKNDCLKVCM